MRDEWARYMSAVADFLSNNFKKRSVELVCDFATLVTVKNKYSQKAHEFAKKYKITILDGTHYSTEKFACISIVDYFIKLGLPVEFIKDNPLMENI